MSLEAATKISELVPTNPDGADARSQGDNHIRMVKAALQYNFPNADKPFYFPNALAKTANYTILAADQGNFISGNATGGAFNLTLPTLAAADDGWNVALMKSDATANAITIVGTVNGVVNPTIATQYSAVMLWWSGSAWFSATLPSYPLLLTLISIVGGTSLAAPAIDDSLPIYDLSATTNKKIALSDLWKVIALLTAETAPAVDDGLALYDTSAGTTDFITLANLLKVLNGLTEDTTPDFTNDFLLSYDASASAVKKVKPRNVGPVGSRLLHIRDEKTSGTSPANITSGAYRTRELTTVKTNEISGASLASNQITLPAGTYWGEFRASGSGLRSNKVKLRDVTNSADLVVGESNFDGTFGTDGYTDRTWAMGEGRFTLAGTVLVELQHQCGTTGPGGTVTSFGDVEVYANVKIWKLD